MFYSAGILAQILYLLPKTKRTEICQSKKIISSKSNEIINNDINLRNIFAQCREVDRPNMLRGKLRLWLQFGFFSDSPFCCFLKKNE